MLKTLLANIALRRVLKDASVWTLFTVNVITIVVAAIQQWDFNTVLWIYFAQSTIIGFFTFLNIIGLKNFSKDSLAIQIRKSDGYSFLLIHSVFHVTFFVIFAMMLSIENYSTLFIIIGLFLANHAYSAIKNRKQNSKNNTNLDKIVGTWSIRMVPIYFGITFLILGGNILPLTGLMTLKLILDIGAHIYKHRPIKQTTKKL